MEQSSSPLPFDVDASEVARCYREGMSIGTISELLSMKVGDVIALLSRHSDIPVKIIKWVLMLKETGKSIQDISKLLNIPQRQLRILVPEGCRSTAIASTDIQSIEAKPHLRQITNVVKSEDNEPTQVLQLNRDTPAKDPKQPAKSHIEDEVVSSLATRRGRKSWPNGDEYLGELANGEPHGNGTMVYGGRDSPTYVGNWAHGKRHGYGVFISTDKCRYEGNWIEDRRHGEGFQSWANGRVYTGFWQDNKVHGNGVGVEPDGAVYSGRWHEGLKEGIFICTRGTTIETESWRAGVRLARL